MDDIKCRALLCEAIALLKEIAESRGQFYIKWQEKCHFFRVAYELP